MTGSVALCIDDASRIDPSLIGLSGELLDRQPWLEVYSNGQKTRERLAENERIQHVWVVSCDDVEPINLAAALKSDRSDLHVSLVQPNVDGSVRSRAHNASIDEVVELSSFVRSYSETKGRCSAVAGDPVDIEPVQVPRHMRSPDEPLERQPRTQPEPQVPRQLTRRSTALASAMPVSTHVGTFVMPVVSGSGGAGKSAVSVLSAHIAARMGFRTLLLDYDLQFGDIAHLSGVQDPTSIDEAFAHPELVDREIERACGPIVLAAPRRLESAELVVKALPDCFDPLVGKFDVVIANTGAAWAEQHAALLERSNAALFLVDQRASSVRACKHALELCSRCGIATGPFQFAVNRCTKSSPLSSIDVSCALRGVPVFELKEGGRDVEDCLSAGVPLELLDSRNDFGTSLEQVLAKLLPGAAGKTSDAPAARLGRNDKRARHAGRKWGKGRS